MSMSYGISPGYERQWRRFQWQWDFTVSTVQEGHKAVDDKDKEDARTQGAKLTFGEVLDCGVLHMLHNLHVTADNVTRFHDLGMGPGKMLIQTFLAFPNLQVCAGVELAVGRYHLAEKNVRKLVKTGWRHHKYLIIEYQKGQFMVYTYICIYIYICIYVDLFLFHCLFFFSFLVICVCVCVYACL